MQIVTQQNNADVIAITETWLNSRITDGAVSLPGYSIVRNDRENGKRGGGVCAFIKSNIPFSTIPNLCTPDVEGLWLRLRPFRLPRELSCIFVGVFFHPPLADNNVLQDYLISTVDKLLLDHPNAGIMILGDFNHFDYKTLCRHSSLKQTVKKPTRQSAILDLILTNMHKWYNEPKIISAIGLSDHLSVLTTPAIQTKQPNNVIKKTSRKTTTSNLVSFGKYVKSLDWSHLYRIPSCQDKCDLFYNLFLLGLDTFLPKKSVKVHCRDKPWITPDLKKLISERQRALTAGNRKLYNQLRNDVRSAIKYAKPSYFQTQVKHLKTADPTKWWKAVKNLAGYTSDKSLQSVINENQILEGKNLANTINKSFVSVNKSMPPLSDFDKQFLNTPCEYYIPVELVERRLERVKISKASGPDSIPNWLLKNFSAELATPVASIFNASIVQAQVPSQWKVADVIPIPKSRPVQDINNDIRPISLTATLSKVLESFNAEWIRDSICQKLDPKQFGAIPGSSPVDALISLLHSLYADSDGNGKTVRLFLLDFSKAFDRINYKILITKMRKLDINPSVINWVIDFLSGRKQRVKMGNVFSDWSSVNGGVPQGTVLGPILFLIMINDLVTDHDRRWKFVDDTSVSEVINKGEQGKMQSLVNMINTWCIDNDMKLNQSKCKDMIISFAKDRPKLDPIFVNNHELVPVSSVKVLGTYISADMKWNTHISYIVSKASKGLYFLRLLKRAGLDHSSQLAVYTTCIRSVLEYGCQVWNYGASQYLSDDVERVQRRALRIIYPIERPWKLLRSQVCHKDVMNSVDRTL